MFWSGEDVGGIERPPLTPVLSPKAVAHGVVAFFVHKCMPPCDGISRVQNTHTHMLPRMQLNRPALGEKQGIETTSRVHVQQYSSAKRKGGVAITSLRC